MLAKTARFLSWAKRLTLHPQARFSTDKPADPNPISEEYLRNMLRRAEKSKLEDETIIVEDTVEEKAQPADIQIKPSKKSDAPEKVIYHESVQFFDESRNVVKTQYGDLQIPDHYMKKYNNKLSNLYYLTNSTKTNFVRKIFKEDKNALMMFTPDANYHNIRNLFDSIVKKVTEFYFNEKNLMTEFKLTENSSEEAKKIYNDTIRKIIDLRKFLNRIVIVVNSDFTLRNENSPEVRQALKTCFDQHDILKNSKVTRQEFRGKLFQPRPARPADDGAQGAQCEEPRGEWRGYRLFVQCV
jgi:hypothetical protein